MWGIIWGTIALIFVGLVSSSVLIGVVVGGATLLMILGALVPALDFVPGQVLGLATTAAFDLLTKASGLDFSLPTGPFTVMLISFLVGAAYGYAGSLLVARLVSGRSATVSDGAANDAATA